MSKKNPFSVVEKILTTVVVAIAWFMVSLVVLGSIVLGFIKGSPWYETFAVPLLFLLVTVVVVIAIVGYSLVSEWWGKKSRAWERKNRESDEEFQKTVQPLGSGRGTGGGVGDAIG